jgi:tRNA(His) 5'-end guanylyltransferase
MANFDSRLWTVPKRSEVINYFAFRQQDATRNSISAVAQSMYSHNQLKGKSGNEMQEMIFQKDGTNWNNFPTKYKRGRGIMKVNKEVEIKSSIIQKATAKAKAEWIERDGKFYVTRNTWEVVDVPIFLKNKSFFDPFLPIND